MAQYAKPLARLVSELEKLPGVGPKSAQRLAFHILRAPKEQALSFAASIVDVRENMRFCSICGNYTDTEICSICTDSRRDKTILCIVAEPRDLFAMERTNEFRGLYHVLQGVISPMDGIGPEKLRVVELMKRLDEGAVLEVILATNPTVEGDTTAMYLAQNLIRPAHPEIRITRIAHGMPIGGDLDYADQATLISALEWRREMR
jgi:recombination protein RecR